MIKDEEKILFESIFPQVKGIQLKTRKETVALAQRVAVALKREREKLVKEQQENNITSGFLPTSS